MKNKNNKINEQNYASTILKLRVSVYNITEITYGMFSEEERKTITTLEIPEGVTTLGYGAFMDFENLKSVTLPNSLTSIGGEAFEGCTSLTSVTIPNSVKSIGWSAFAYCSSLIRLSIPDSVTSIDNFAFMNCTGLISVTIPDSVKSIGANAFAYCRRLTEITIPDSVREIGEGAFYGSTFCCRLIFKDLLLDEVKAMTNYPWGVYNASHIYDKIALEDGSLKDEFEDL